MGKVHVGDLLRIGHKLWYRIGCGPGMPGPYSAEGEVSGIEMYHGPLSLIYKGKQWPKKHYNCPSAYTSMF